MIFKAREGKISVGKSDMHYISFGTGSKNLVIIAGLGDGLKSIKGQSLTLAYYFREYSREFRVYIFGRKENLPRKYSILDMAKDQKIAMDILGLTSAHIMGISQGGMIAQQIAIDYPYVIDRLVLSVSVSRPTDTLKTVLSGWIDMAEKGDYKELLRDTMEKTYTQEKYNKYKVLLPIFSLIGRPKSFERFIVQANACLQYNVYDKLNLVSCPTLVIGGDNDKVTGPLSSEEMSHQIQGSKLILYKGLGHGAYEEAKDYNRQVIRFLNEGGSCYEKEEAHHEIPSGKPMLFRKTKG